jgi:cytochrome b6-f complex iron-sulfur subunit
VSSRRPNPGSLISNRTRRDFLKVFTRGTVAAAFGGLVYQAARFFSADVSTQPPHLFTLGRPADYAPGTITFEPAARVFVGHDARGLFAVNATCTHLGCTVNHKKNQFECPCHGSQFDAQGRVLVGPATRTLERVRLTLSSDGRIVADRSASVNVDFRLAAAFALAPMPKLTPES